MQPVASAAAETIDQSVAVGADARIGTLQRNKTLVK